ncbi:MAG: site-specific DNA-methyltransferase [Actinobacteria bacterium]|nr:site-specific DNA-methyltransferase [Actinomycetota bacterium]
MAVKRKKQVVTDAAPVASYKFEDKRKRIPTQEESEKLSASEKQPVKKKYDYDPSLDPQLVWSGKKEAGSEFEVATVPVYVQEKIAPEAIIARLKAGVSDSSQMLLFGETAQEQFGKAIEFYKHEDNWQNRMILGDSLLVMNSLLDKEGMRGKIQIIYIDPPYGIKFGSNWQVSTRKRDVKDNKIDDFIRQPEQIKAFRDTWELGIHSYLSYLRDRLILARELLTESGSCFVQINDENVHLVRNIMDEVFGSDNFINQLGFRTAMTKPTDRLNNIFDYILWYAKHEINLKYRPLYVKREYKDENEIVGTQQIEASVPQAIYSFNYKGKLYNPKNGWRVSEKSLKKLAELNRLYTSGTLRFIRYTKDFPYIQYDNIWNTQLSEQNKSYVVQTSIEVIKRCVLMTTDPGDLVLDPTCGSGTTAYVAEQWGRRWITIDTSRVALALARTRLMTAKYSYYKLKEQDSINAGFEYKTVPHVTLKSLANDEEPEQEILYDQPLEDKNIIRVTGPFTVESLSPHRISDAQEMISSERFVDTVIENMLRAGVQTGGKDARVEFLNLDIIPSGPEVQAVGEYKTKEGPKKVAVAIGPEFGSLDDDFIIDASNVAKKFAELLIVAATSFDASAISVPAEIDGLKIMRVKINPDLSMGDLLKKTGSGNLFIAFGEPELKVKETKKGIVVEILGVDVYDPVKAEIRSSGSGNLEYDIAAWFIDTNYNGEAFFVTHAYFLGNDKPYKKLRKALKANIDESIWEELYSTVSRPFQKPQTGKIAVKVINHFGDEVMKVIEIR